MYPVTPRTFEGTDADFSIERTFSYNKVLNYINSSAEGSCSYFNATISEIKELCNCDFLVFRSYRSSIDSDQVFLTLFTNFDSTGYTISDGVYGFDPIAGLRVDVY